MSAEARTKIAQAASAVEGISCTPYWRQTTKAGDAMVRLGTVDFPNKFGGLITWQVVIVLPKDMAAAEKWIDENLDAVTEALWAEMAVRRAIPQQTVMPDGTSVPTLWVEGQREQ